MQIKIISLAIQSQNTNYYTCTGGTLSLYCVFEQYYYVMNFREFDSTILMFKWTDLPGTTYYN